MTYTRTYPLKEYLCEENTYSDILTSQENQVEVYEDLEDSKI